MSGWLPSWPAGRSSSRWTSRSPKAASDPGPLTMPGATKSERKGRKKLGRSVPKTSRQSLGWWTRRWRRLYGAPGWGRDLALGPGGRWIRRR